MTEYSQRKVPGTLFGTLFYPEASRAVAEGLKRLEE